MSGSESGAVSRSSWGDGTRSVRGGEGDAVPGAPLRPSPQEELTAPGSLIPASPRAT